MLDTLHIRQFTVFKEASFEFSPGLNVVTGDNGTGKTHLLKLGYLFCRAWPDLTAKRLQMTKERAESYLDDRLAGLFRVSDLAALIRRGGSRSATTLAANVSGHVPTVQISLAREAPPVSAGLPEPMPWEIRIEQPRDRPAHVRAQIVPDSAVVNAFLPRPVFVPSKEMVSLFNGLIALFDKYRDFPFDETYRDLAVALSTLEPRDASPLLPDIVQRIQKLLGGELKLENSDLSFVRDDGSRLESQLMAEGHRKLALLIYMLRFGVLERGSTLFWDEPEANLNDFSVKLLAEALHVLAGSGVQVIVATHSLFLLREFEILQMNAAKKKGFPEPRYFGLGFARNGVTVTQGPDIADIDPLVLLDENLKQSDRFLAADQ